MSFSKKIAKVLYDNKSIDEEEKEFVEYGLEVFFSSMIEIFAILIISIFVGNFIETFVFFIAFVPLRIYAGGFHADTKLGCFLVSLLVYLGYTILLFNIEKNIYHYVITGSVITSIIVTYLKAPILHKNKNRTDKEIKTYRKLAVAISVIEGTICLVCSFVIAHSSVILSFALGMFAVTVSMFMAIIKNKILL